MTEMDTEQTVFQREVRKLPVADLQVSDLNVRFEADPEGIDALAESIRTVGLQHPLVVRRVPDTPDVYEVVEGSRRLEAVKKLGWTYVDCRVATEMSDQQAIIASVEENLKRGDISAAELKRAIDRLMEMMPPEWTEKKKRKAVAERLNWYTVDSKGKRRPDLTRVKDAILMGEFQLKLPGVVIKQRTRGDSRKPTLAWSTAKQVRDILGQEEIISYLEHLSAEEQQKYVVNFAEVYRKVPSKFREEFKYEMLRNPRRPPEDVLKNIEEKRIKQYTLACRVDKDLFDQITEVAAKQNLPRSEVLQRIIRKGLPLLG